MRKIFAFLMVSLDGYHEGLQSELDWHNVDDEFHDFAVDQLDAADALLFGRRTYQMMAEFWRSRAALEADPEVAAQLNGLPKFVASRTLSSATWKTSTLLGADAADRLAQVKRQQGKDIALLGSSALTASLLPTGLVDELRIMVNPVLIGAGQPLLAGVPRCALELRSTRLFRSGNVLLTYRSLSSPAMPPWS